MPKHQKLPIQHPSKKELPPTQNELTNIENLAIIGKHSAEVAHELNNPLDGILRYINLTMRSIEQGNIEKSKEYLAQCRQGLMRMIQIVSELLEFSRSNYPPQEEHIKIEQVIEDSVKTMAAKAESSNVLVSQNHHPQMPLIKSVNLFAVFCNLIKNAIDAMPNGGQLNISTKLTADNFAAIEFRDTGTGFASEDAEAIFEPFYTTKNKGTGLGLAICKDIIEKYNGRITAENAPQGGGIFTVYLPAGRGPQR